MIRRRALLAGVAAGAVTGTVLGACAPSSARRRLRFWNWDTYIGATTLADFEAASGIGVDMTLLSGSDEVFAKLRAGNPGYDVIMANDDVIPRLVAAKMIVPLDHTRLPNLANLDPAAADPPFDRGSRYSAMYSRVYVGIGYRKPVFTAPPDSWGLLLTSRAHAGRIALYQNFTSLLIGALALGVPLAAIDRGAVERIVALLVAQKPNIRAFHGDTGQDLLVSRDADLVSEANGDIAQVAQEDPGIGFAIPREGGIAGTNSLVIASGAPDAAGAHAFIDFILGAVAGAEIARTIRYPTPNAAARALLPAAMLADPSIYPPPDAVARCQFAPYRGEAQMRMYDDAMTRVMAA